MPHSPRITQQMDGMLSEDNKDLKQSVQDPAWLCSNDPFTKLATQHQMRECLNMVRICSSCNQAGLYKHDEIFFMFFALGGVGAYASQFHASLFGHWSGREGFA